MHNEHDGNVCFQVRYNLQVEAIWGASNSVSRRRTQQVHSTERGETVRVQLPQKHWWNTREMVHVGLSWRHAQRHAGYITQLSEPRQAQNPPLERGGETHPLGSKLLEPKLHILGPG